MSEGHPDWRTEGVRVVRAGELDTNTLQTPGMSRAAAINRSMIGCGMPTGAKRACHCCISKSG